MSDWNHCIATYAPPSQKESDLIIAALTELIPCFSGPVGSTADFRTRFVKRKLAILGHKLGQRVYANHLSIIDVAAIGNGFVNTEWLYDLHWYSDGNKRPYCQNSMKLVMECEWGKNRHSKTKKVPPVGLTQAEKKMWNEALDEHTEVKYDFQKLLVTNAELRLMVFGVRGDAYSVLDKLLESYFVPAIDGYELLPAGAQFLLVAYHFQGNRCNGLYWKDIVKRSNS